MPSYPVGAGHPSNDPEPSGGNGGGQGPHWDPPSPPPLPNTPPPGWTPDPIATIEEITSPVVVDTSGGGDTGGGIIDVAAEQDAIDDALAIAAVNPVSISHHPTEGVVQHNPNYIPPDQYYGANQAGVIPGQTVYATTNIDPNSNMYQALQGMDANTLAFFGYTPGDTTVPNELLNSVAQGSIVSGNEAVTSNEPYITTWSNLEDLTLQAQAGNQAAIDALGQTLFPGGLPDYHNITSQPFITPIPPATSFDDWWHDDPGTPWDQQWYDHPAGDEDTIMAQLGTWRADPLPTESISMGEREQMYDRELRKELMASPLFMAGMEDVTGIPYRGRPEFGTIEMDVV